MCTDMHCIVAVVKHHYQKDLREEFILAYGSIGRTFSGKHTWQQAAGAGCQVIASVIRHIK